MERFDARINPRYDGTLRKVFKEPPPCPRILYTDPQCSELQQLDGQGRLEGTSSVRLVSLVCPLCSSTVLRYRTVAEVQWREGLQKELFDLDTVPHDLHHLP